MLFGCKKSPQQVDVQIFIVTKNGDNVKLGLVEVKAYPYDSVFESLKSIKEKRTAALSELDKRASTLEKKYTEEVSNSDAAIASAHTKWLHAATASDNALKVFNQTVDSADSVVDKYVNSLRFDDDIGKKFAFEESFEAIELKFSHGDLLELAKPDKAIKIVNKDVWKYLPQLRSSVISSASALKSAIEQEKTSKLQFDTIREKKPDDGFRQEIAHERENLLNPENFYNSLPSTNYFAKTDADGKCRLLLPPNQQWIIAAVGRRELPHEQYVWIVSLPQKNVEKYSIILSNDNMLGEGSSLPFL